MKIFVYIFVISVIVLGVRYMLKLLFPDVDIPDNPYPDYSLNFDYPADLQSECNINPTPDSLQQNIHLR